MVQEIDKQLYRFEANAGMSPSKILDPKDHYGSNALISQDIADTCRMTHQDVFLQTPDVFSGDGFVAQGAKPCCDAIDNPAVLEATPRSVCGH